MDWLRSIFLPSLPLAEIFLRGTIVYLFLFLLLRFLRREAGEIGISDILVIVLVSDAAQNAMTSEYKSITEGLLLVATIAFWDYFLDWIGYKTKSRLILRLLRPPPLLLIKDGRLQKQNLKRELIEEEELMGQLREHGIEKIADVKKCFLESDGRISVIKRVSEE